MDETEPLFLFFDYVDPASFLMELQIRELGDLWTSLLVPEPFEVSPPPSDLLDPGEGPWRDRWAAMTLEGETRGLELKRPWIVPWSRKAHELARHARECGCFREIHDALYRAYLMNGQDIGRIDVLVELAGDHGLDLTDTKAVLDIDLYSDELEKKRERALALAVTGPPTLVWKNEKLEGFQDGQALRAFLDACRENHLNR